MTEAEVGSAQTASAPRGSRGLQQVSTVAPGHFVLSGELDASNAHLLQSALDTVGGATGDCIIDCEAVLYMDSSALHVFLRAAHILQENGRKLVIFSPSPFARRLLEVTGITHASNIEVHGSR